MNIVAGRAHDLSVIGDERFFEQALSLHRKGLTHVRSFALLARRIVAVTGITNLPGTGRERIGRNGNWGAAAAPDGICQPLTQDTQAGCKTDGFVTDFSWGYRMFSIISLPRPARGIDLQTLVSWNHDVDGYAVDGSQIEGRQIFGLRLQALFQRTWFLEIGRTWVHSTTDYDIARDKDVYSIAAGVAF